MERVLHSVWAVQPRWKGHACYSAIWLEGIHESKF